MSELQLYEYSNTKNPTTLVMILHGYGANGENLINLAYEFKHELPDAHFIAPNAVEPWEGGFPDAYQWFSLSSGFERKSIAAMTDSVKSSQRILGKLIDDQLARFKINPENLFLIGFSQGAMMAAYQAMIRTVKPKAVISFSGRLILPELLGEKTVSKPEICLIHGENDSVVPFDSFLEAQKTLKENSFNFESHSIPKLDHSIDLHGIRMARAFIKQIQGKLNSE